ncbi:MAG: hypothetical protein PVH56_11925 [Desulfobacterales bacterium]
MRIEASHGFLERHCHQGRLNLFYGVFCSESQVDVSGGSFG